MPLIAVSPCAPCPCSCGLTIPAQRIGNFDTELVEHFFSVSKAGKQGCGLGAQGA